VAFNYTRSQQTAHRQIARFGGPAKLRRNGVDRDCTAAVVDFDPKDRNLILDGARRVLVSPLHNGAPLAIPPNHEQDLLIYKGEVLMLVQPPRGPRPAAISIFYDLAGIYKEAGT